MASFKRAELEFPAELEMLKSALRENGSTLASQAGKSKAQLVTVAEAAGVSPLRSGQFVDALVADFAGAPDETAAVMGIASTEEDGLLAADEENFSDGHRHRHRATGRATCGACAVVALVWLILVPAGVFGAIKLFDKLTFADFKTKPGTTLGQSHWYVDQWGYMGTQQIMKNPVYITLQSNPPGESVIEGIRAIEMDLFADVAVKKLKDTFGSLTGWPLGGVHGYYIPDSYGFQNLDYVAGANNDTTQIVINWETQASKPYTADIENYIAGALADDAKLFGHNRYTFTVSGMPQLLTAMKDDVLKNMATIDAIGIPIGLVLFAICVRTSPFAVLVPLATLPASLAIALGASSPLHNHMKITAFAPEMMLSVVIALTMDFGLFLLTRIKEDLDEEKLRAAADEQPMSPTSVAQLNRPRHIVVMHALKHVSHNIAISGFAITIAFGALASIDVDFIRSCALVSAIGALTTTLISLTLLPAVATLLFPILFNFECCGKNKSAANEVDETATDQSLPLIVGDDPKVSADEANESQSKCQQWRDKFLALVATPDVPEHNMWGRAATFSSRHPFVVLLPVLILIGTLLYVLLTGFRADLNSFATCPHDIKYWDYYHDQHKLFGRKTMTPYYVLVVNETDDGNPMSPSGFDFMTKLVDQLLADSSLGLTLESIRSPTVFRSKKITFNDSVWLQEHASGPANTTEGIEYQLMLDTVWSKLQGWSYHSPLVAIALTPAGRFSNSWGAPFSDYMESLKKFVEGPAASIPRPDEEPVFVGFYGGNPGAWAVMERVMSKFDLQVAITFGTLTIAIALLMRSFVIALRMILTMTFTVIFTFGTVTFLMHYGYFSALWPALEYIEGYYWAIPVLVLPMVCVVSLDYDVFLVTRLLELRSRTADELPVQFAVHRGQGYSHESACTISAVARTGPVISWAAAIMVMAFGMLAFANTVMMAQYGLTVALAVVFDAFLVRPIVVPAFISLIPGRVLWFPRRFANVELM